MKTIDVQLSGKIITIPYSENQTILEILRNARLLLPSPCGGKGTCGKCKITIVDADGCKKDVLACQNTPVDRTIIELPMQHSLHEKIVDHDTDADTTYLHYNTSTSTTSSHQGNSSYGIAVDLGTTTIVVTLVDLDTKIPVKTIKEWNQQISVGSDVISRIDYCMKNPDHLSELSSMIQTQIRRMIDEICSELDIPFSNIKRMTVSGNTIMEHLFTGIDPTPIASAPFIPQTLFLDFNTCHFDAFEHIDVMIMPCISGFLGGDIISGLYNAREALKSGYNLFLDIGTNGEMILGVNGQYKGISVACGPALEGAEIACGMNSVKGAINHIRWDEKTCKAQIETIYDGHPQGLCASGMIDFLYLLRSTGLLTAEGRILNTKEARKQVHRLTLAKLKNTFGYDCLRDDTFGNGIFTIHKNPDIYMTTKDCQNLLKAIAAVKTGIEILLYEQAIDTADLNHFIIAGGLGEHIDSRHAISIGMFPEHIDEKLLCAGNTSLKGTISALCDPEVLSVMNNISQHVDYQELANHSDFADTYIKHLKYK